MKKVYSKIVRPDELSHELHLLQECGYTINNVYQDHMKEFGLNNEKGVYTIVFERECAPVINEEEAQKNLEECYKLIKDIFKTEEEFNEFLKYIMNNEEANNDKI